MKNEDEKMYLIKQKNILTVVRIQLEKFYLN